MNEINKLVFFILIKNNINCVIMKYIVSEQELEIPEGVTVDVKSRTVTVKGKLGTLTKSFKHIPFEMVKEKNKKGSPALKFRMWLQKKKRNAVLGTVRSTIRNMINGVTNGYKFKMVLAYSHFPIVVNIIEGGNVILNLIFSQSKLRTFWVSR
jgi:large subunit ribosomal protein L9e